MFRLDREEAIIVIVRVQFFYTALSFDILSCSKLLE